MYEVLWIHSDITSKESTLQLVYDILRLTPFYKAFLVTADVPEIYMQEFWATATVHHHSIRFKMNNKKRIINLEYFREMLHICLRIPNHTFDELPFEEEILAFMIYHGHSKEIKKITDVNINKLHQPWRSFAAFINKCLSGKSTVEHKDAKKSNEMYNPRFTKVIINFFMTKDPSILRRNKFGAMLPVELTNEDIRNSAAYKEYYAIASGAAPPKTKASARKMQSSFDTTMTPLTAAGIRILTLVKGKQPTELSKAKSLYVLYKVALTEVEHMMLATKRSLQQTHISQASRSGADEGTGIIPGVPDVPTYESDEEISWKSSDDDDDDDVDDQSDVVVVIDDDDDDQDNEDEQDDDDQDDNDDDQDSDNDDDDFVHPKLDADDDDDKDQKDEDEQDDDDQDDNDDHQDSDDDGDDFVHPKLSTHDEETKDEESFYLIVQTLSQVENSDNESNDDESHGMNVGGDEGPDAEDDDEEFYGDVNLNLEGGDIQMTDVHTTQLLKDTHVTLTSVNPDVTTTVETLLLTAPTLPPPSIPTISQVQQAPAPSPTTAPSTFLQDLSNFGSLFGFDHRLKTLEANFSEFIQTNQFAKAVSSIHGIVDRYIDHRINEAVKVESIHRFDEQRNLYKALVDAYECDKIILDTYGDTITLKRRRDDEDKDEEPFVGSDRGSKRRRAGKEPESTSAPKEKLKVDTLTPELLAGPTYELMKGSCRDVQMTDVHTTQVLEDTHVTLTPVNPDGQQQSLVDVPVSTTVVPLLVTAPTIPPPSTLIISQVQQALIPSPRTAPSSFLQDLPNSGSLFGLDHRLKTLEANFSEFMQTNQFAKVVSSIPGIVDRYIDHRMNEVLKIIKEQVKEQVKVQVSKILPKIEKTINEQLKAEVLTRASNSSKTSYVVAADLSESELKKILIEKMESNKSIHRSAEKRNLYKALVDAYKCDKIILDTYEDTVTLKTCRNDEDKDEEPSAGLDGGPREDEQEKSQKEPMQTTKDLEEPSHQEFKTGAANDQPVAEAFQHLEWFQKQTKPLTPNRAWNKTLLAINESIQPWISDLAKQANSRTSFNKLMDTPVDFSAFLMNRLKIDTLTPELLAGPTYELMKGSCKSLQYPHNRLKRLPLVPNSRGRRVIPFNQFINNDLEYLRGGASGRKYTTSVTKTKAADYGHIKWIEDLVPRTIWSQAPVSYDKYALWGISHWGRKRQQFYGFAVNRESARDVYSKHRSIAVTKLQTVEWHNYKHLDWITMHRDDDKLYKLKEGDLKRLRIQDIEYMLLFLVKGKLTNLTVKERFAFNVSLRMFTRSIVIQRRV
nr:hypothetical protein [Tanacetum cinerariifolium]